MSGLNGEPENARLCHSGSRLIKADSTDTQPREPRSGLLLWAKSVEFQHAALTGFQWPAEPIPSDASNRLAFRVKTHAGSVILIDSPPQTENNGQFAALAGWYLACGLKVPVIYAMNLADGYFAVSDLGEQTWLDMLKASPDRADEMYSKGLLALCRLASRPHDSRIPEYSQGRFSDELELFSRWCVEAWLHLSLPAFWPALCEELLDTIAEQPRVCVHRDFHSRNLMVQPDVGTPGIVDYQDTLIGPLTYDVGSLLWDCYIDWPEQQVLRRLEFFRQQLAFVCGLKIDADRFVRWAKLTVSQRHLKAMGIFARLHVQENRHNYLACMPRVLGYLENHLSTICPNYLDWSVGQLRPAVASRLSRLGS